MHELVINLADGSVSAEDWETFVNTSSSVLVAEDEEQWRNLEAITPPMVDGKYDVLLADPPWRYKFTKTKSRAFENQYHTMALENIKRLQVPSEDNAVLFLWATAPKLLEALDVMAAWGFEYKTCAVWDKAKLGMGFWFRGQHEL